MPEVRIPAGRVAVLYLEDAVADATRSNPALPAMHGSLSLLRLASGKPSRYERDAWRRIPKDERRAATDAAKTVAGVGGIVVAWDTNGARWGTYERRTK